MQYIKAMETQIPVTLNLGSRRFRPSWTSSGRMTRSALPSTLRRRPYGMISGFSVQLIGTFP